MHREYEEQEKQGYKLGEGTSRKKKEESLASSMHYSILNMELHMIGECINEWWQRKGSYHCKEKN